MIYEWAVIGAGPAGIAAMGKLLDQGISPQAIAWVDPVFKVGDFGTIWRNVPSNTRVKLFVKFLEACHAFSYKDKEKTFHLDELDPEQTCALHYMAEPLQWVTNQLKKKVHAISDIAENFKINNRTWEIKLKSSLIKTRNAILAIGAEPKNLTYPALPIVSLQDGMDHERIKDHLAKNDTVAVFGSSHSAILVLRNLVENHAHKIINFYRSPLRYAVYLDDWILFDDTGLKGTTAAWARKYIDGEWPKNLARVYASDEDIQHFLPQCNKAIYAVGFEKRLLPSVDNIGPLTYIEQCGIIAPGLFGCGIAFPEAKYNPYGLLEYRVGLWKFMDYLNRVIPVWLKYGL